MARRTLWLTLLVSALTLAAHAQPVIDHVEPYRLKVQQNGWVELRFFGNYPAFTGGHPDYDQYEHWYVTRDGRPWVLCAMKSSSCRMSGWAFGMMAVELNAAEWLTTPGLIDFKMNEGLTSDGHIDTPFSNAVRVPVLAAFGAPPVVVSISKKEFVSGGAEDQFVFRMAANNFDERSVVAVFDGDVVIHPRRIYDGTTIEIAVPAKYRNADGEIPVQLRTDSGGYSEKQYIRILKPKAPTPMIVGKIAHPAIEKPNAPATGGVHVSPDAMLANRVRDAIVAKIGEATVRTLTISASAGSVTLGGSLATAALRDEAKAAATNVGGVRRVVSNVAIK